MTIAFSQQDFWNLIKQPQALLNKGDATASLLLERTWQYPTQWGQGYWREIDLKPGLSIEIGHYSHSQPLVMEIPERLHPIELYFCLSDGYRGSQSEAGQCWLYSSGLAASNSLLHQPHPPVLEVSLHIEPEVFYAYLGDGAPGGKGLHRLLQPSDQPYQISQRSIGPGLQAVLQQVVQCSYRGLTQRLYLEGKVLELLALLLEQERATPKRHALKPEDVERIHYARELLLADLVNPPSLLELARQAGLNDCTLKRGFRQVFNTTVFGCLQAQRMEQARLLLLERQLSVQQAARSVGYASRSHFTAAFRKQFGISPRSILSQGR